MSSRAACWQLLNGHFLLLALVFMLSGWSLQLRAMTQDYVPDKSEIVAVISVVAAAIDLLEWLFVIGSGQPFSPTVAIWLCPFPGETPHGKYMVLSERLLKDSLTRAEREDSSTENVIMSLTALPPAWDLRCTSVRHQDHASRLPNSGRRTGLCNCLNIEVIARGQEELSRQDAKSSAQLWDLARTEEHQAEAVDKLAWYFLNCLPCCLLQV